MLSGTGASLGVLMGYIFRRNSGRAWHLRKRSMELWPSWVKNLHSEECPLSIKKPLIQLARSNEEAIRMRNISSLRCKQGLYFLEGKQTNASGLPWPKNLYGGLVSENDGFIDPLELQKSLKKALIKEKVEMINKKVTSINRSLSGYSWELKFQTGGDLKCNIVIICAASGTEKLLAPLGHKISLTSVLGQVLELEIASDKNNWINWPAVLVSNGINLLPYGPNKLLIGATLETGMLPNDNAAKELIELKGNAPAWLNKAKVVNNWYGFRSRPDNRPAPILEKLEEGLILASGHYRNGILLTPSTAEWIRGEIDKSK